jgi:hypothetical protein
MGRLMLVGAVSAAIVAASVGGASSPGAQRGVGGAQPPSFGVAASGKGYRPAPAMFHVPVNPPGAPPLPVGVHARNAPVGAVREVTHVGNCYGPGQSGYQSDCVNPGFEGSRANPGVHWGNEPYYNSGKRFVWIVDELGPGRERDWLQYVVNAWNSVVDATHQNRPYLLYSTGESGGPVWSNCAIGARQIMEFCYAQGQVRSYSNYTFDGSGHFQVVSAHIGSLARAQSDVYVEYSVAHEFGHIWGGFAHNTDCASVMTYCSTVGNQLLWYSADDFAVYAANYDVHPAN